MKPFPRGESLSSVCGETVCRVSLGRVRLRAFLQGEEVGRVLLCGSEFPSRLLLRVIALVL